MGVSIQISAERLRRGHAVYTPCHWQDFSPRISLLFTIAMLPHRYPTKAVSNTSSRLTSGSVSGRRPSNLATHQRPFYASTAQAVETESFVSETSPSEILPVPPLPASFLPSPPDNSRPRRQQIRRDTLETLCSPTSEEHVPQPPNIMPMPTPSVSQTPVPSASRQPAPGSGVGGFTSIPLPHHESSRGYNTADYTRWFDQKFSTHSDSSSPPYETAGTSEGVHAGIWATYNKVSQEFDEKWSKKWNEDLDVLLIFVSLVVNVVDDH
jgi:hypothetical protein